MGVDGVVEVAEEGVVDDADAGEAVVGEGEGDADVGVAVDEVRGAVDGVADEGGGRGEGRAGGVGFFAEESGGVGGVSGWRNGGGGGSVVGREEGRDGLGGKGKGEGEMADGGEKEEGCGAHS